MDVEIEQSTVTDEELKPILLDSYLRTLRKWGKSDPKEREQDTFGYHLGFSWVLEKIDSEKLTLSDILDPSNGHKALRQILLDVMPENLLELSAYDGLTEVMNRIDNHYQGEQSPQPATGEKRSARRLGRLSLESQ